MKPTVAVIGFVASAAASLLAAASQGDGALGSAETLSRIGI